MTLSYIVHRPHLRHDLHAWRCRRRCRRQRLGIATTNVTTSACPDTTPPSTPTGLATSAVAATSATLSWTASTDNVGVTGYHTFRGATQAGTPTTTSYSFTGLTCGTTYTLGVAAVDAAGNASATATTSVTTSACADTTPPSTPTGLATSGIGPTAATLSWTASNDNVGVTGYRLYLNGSQVDISLTTSYLFTSLVCGTSYTLGVAAVDFAGNVSGVATLAASSASCSSLPSTANVFVSPTGSDSGANCKRLSPASGDPGSGDCLTLAKACSLAQPGDVVGITGNLTATQRLANTDCPNASSSGQITFEPISAVTPSGPGAASGAPLIGGSCSNDCIGLILEGGTGRFGSGGSGTNGPSYVTFKNLHVQGAIEATGNQGEAGSSTTGVGVVFDHVSTGAIFPVGLRNVLLENSNIGPCYNDEDTWSGNRACYSHYSADFSYAGSGGGRQKTSGTFTHDVFHDYESNTSGDHGECYFTLDARVFTIEDSRFYNCDIAGIRIERINNPADESLTIQNNWFGLTAETQGGSTRCSGVTWGSNSGSLQHTLIRYNSFADGQGPVGSSGSPTSTFRIVGNIIGLDPVTDSCAEATPITGNYGSAIVSGNVWIGHDFGTNSAHVVNESGFNAMYLNSSNLGGADYHLSGLPGSTAADNHVPCSSGDAALSVDTDGNSRPHNPPNCDAGAQER